MIIKCSISYGCFSVYKKIYDKIGQFFTMKEILDQPKITLPIKEYLEKQKIIYTVITINKILSKLTIKHIL
jgi:hypothetical protein